MRTVLFDNWFVSSSDEQVKQKSWRVQGFKDAACTLSRSACITRTDPPQMTMASITGKIYRLCQECEPERLEHFEEVLSMRPTEQFLLCEELSRKMKMKWGCAVKRPLEGASAASTQPVPPTGKRPLEGASAASTQPVKESHEPLPPTQHSEMHVDTPPSSPRPQDLPVPASAFRGNRPHGDDKERKDFVSRVKDGDSRVMKPAEVTGAQLQQIMMDHACLLLSSFHRIVSPYASVRCAVNPNTNCLVRSITNRSRFVQDASRFAYKLLFGDHLATDLPGNFSMLPVARDVTHLLVVEACKQKRGRWQWVGFTLSDWEFEHCKSEILFLFVAGLTSDSAPAVSI